MLLPTDAALSVYEAQTYIASPPGDVISVGIDRAVITQCDGCQIVSIMGTADPAQWVSDFKIVGVEAKRHPLLGDCESGFLDGAVDLYKVLTAHMSKDPVILQGHSRGAGMVPIIAGLMLLDGEPPIRCVCWESPWAVGVQCKDMLLTAGVDGIQYWHGDDPVPCIPAVPWLVPNVWPIKHFGSWKLDPFDCHMMSGIVQDMVA